MRQQVPSPDLEIARIATRQHGVIGYAQLLAAGLTQGGIARRAKAGRLHRIHRSVYAVGHTNLTHESRCMAAALACGASAVVSHRSASVLWGLLPPTEEIIHLTLPGTGRVARRRGLRIHRSRSLTHRLTTRRRGIPITKPTRTIADLRRTVSAQELRRAIRQAGVLELPIEAETEPDPTRSDLERLFLRLCRRHGLPTPEVNVRVGPHEVDFLWPDRRLVVETDSYRFHRGKAAFEDDRARDLKLRALGYEVIRLSYRQVVDDQAGTAGALKGLLGG